MTDGVPVRCRKCRKMLFLHPEFPLHDVHGNVINSKNENQGCCMSTRSHSVWYLDAEKIPSWISSHIEEAGWTKGKLFCPNCRCCIGSFDFVSGGQCSCRSYALPPLHLIKAKVDAVSDYKLHNFETGGKLESL